MPKMPHSRHMSREIRQIEKKSEKFGYWLGETIVVVTFWTLSFTLKLMGKILVITYNGAKTSVEFLMKKVQEFRSP